MKLFFILVSFLFSFKLNAQIDPKTSSNGASIVPEKNSVRAGGTVNINLYDQYGTLQSGPFIGTGSRQQIGSRYWAVNGVRDGDDKAGYVRPSSHTSSTAISTYTAPDILPQQNPVVIQFFFEYYSEAMGKEIWGIISCKIEVYDEYKITVEATFPLIGQGEIKDASNLTVRVFNNHLDFHKLHNQSPTITKQPIVKAFKYSAEGCLGPVHINTSLLEYFDISKNSPPEISFMFKPVKVAYAKVTVTGGRISKTENLELDSQPATDIKFTANGLPQLIEVMATTGISLKTIVEPVRDKGN